MAKPDPITELRELACDLGDTFLAVDVMGGRVEFVARLWIRPGRGARAKLQRANGSEEAGAGIEPANRGFADPDLTTWLPRRNREPERRRARWACQRREELDCCLTMVCTSPNEEEAAGMLNCSMANVARWSSCWQLGAHCPYKQLQGLQGGLLCLSRIHIRSFTI